MGHSEETRKKLALINTKHGNARRSVRYRAWERAVKVRDNRTCRYCGKADLKGRNCQAHHILDYATHIEERYNVDNGLTLCVSCHAKEPKIKKET
jgi:5-methylcytosine-specific restriction endonuclease McrA